MVGMGAMVSIREDPTDAQDTCVLDGRESAHLPGLLGFRAAFAPSIPATPWKERSYHRGDTEEVHQLQHPPQAVSILHCDLDELS